MFKMVSTDYGAEMNYDAGKPGQLQPSQFAEWRKRHPEFTDEEWAQAMRELHIYLRLAWAVYRQQYPDLDLPDTL